MFSLQKHSHIIILLLQVKKIVEIEERVIRRRVGAQSLRLRSGPCVES